MPFDMSRIEDVDVATLSTDCTPEDLAELVTETEVRVESDPRHMIVVASDVQYVGSSFVGRLLALRKVLDDGGTRVVIARPARILSKVLDALGLLELLPIEDSKDAALKRLQAG